MKIMVTGANGQLGFDVLKELKNRKIDCMGVDINDFDITSKEAVFAAVKAYMPDAIIHCAAYTAVDKAEDEPELCEKINAGGTRNIAEACKEFDVKMMLISTDYVFDGEGETPYETGDTPNPKNVYGKTKLMAENAVKSMLTDYFIVRISWVFGVNGNNFVKTMLKLAETREEINVVDDQTGSPTYTKDLAKLLCDMIVTDKFGVYHATNEGFCSWADFDRKIFEFAGKNVTVNSIKTADYPTKAARPKNSRLSKRSLDDAGFERMPRWEDAVEEFLRQEL